MKKTTLIFLLCLAAAAFTSCGSNKVQGSNLNKVFVTNTKMVDLLPTNAITKPIEQYQKFEGSFGNSTTVSATLYLVADRGGMDVLILNDFGIEMGSISYDGMNASLQSDMFPKNLKIEYVILDLQNAYADVNRLKQHYKEYGLTFEERKYDSICTIRSVSRKGKVIEEILMTDKSYFIINRLRNYQYKLTVAE